MRRRTSFLVLGLIAGLLAASGASGAADLQRCEDVKLDQQQRLDACEQIEGSPVSAPRDRARALLQIGRLVQWTSGGIEKAISAWEKAIAADPSFTPPLVARAEWFVLYNQGHEAIKLLQPALAANPKEIDVLVMMGRAYANVRNFNQALRSFDEALKLDPKHVNALFEVAKIFEMNSDFARAAEIYEKAGEKYDPSVISETGHGIEHPYLLAARNYEYMGEVAKALPLVTRVIDADVSGAADPRNYEQRATYYEALGSNGEAIADLTSALRYAPPNEHARLLLRRAILYKKDDKDQQAREDFRKALDFGDRRTILRIQVYLRNQGFAEVEINGTSGPELLNSIAVCLAATKCGAGLGKPI